MDSMANLELLPDDDMTSGADVVAQPPTGMRSNPFIKRSPTTNQELSKIAAGTLPSVTTSETIGLDTANS